MKKIFTFLISLALLQNTSAQSGRLDSTFGQEGIVLTAIGTTSDQIVSMDVQSDGKIVVAGSSMNGNNYNYVLARYNYDGSLDMDFDGDGIVVSSDVIYEAAVQNDGKIVAAGSNAGGFILTRYNANGSLDKGFGNNGKVIIAIGANSSASDIAFQEDGKIVVSGRSMGNFALARYNINGTLDPTFDYDGIVTTSLSSNPVVSSGANAIVIQKDGKIIAAGSGYDISYYAPLGDFALARYNIDGSLDSSFNRNGKVFTHFGGEESATSIALQADGKILVGGNRYYGHRNDCVLARYTTDGRIDTSFNRGVLSVGFGPTSDYTVGVAVQNDGKVLLLAGTTQIDSRGLFDPDFAMVRYTTDGLADLTFGKGGTVISAISKPQGTDRPYAFNLHGNRIYLAGYSMRTFSIAAYQNDLLSLPLKLLNFSAGVNGSSVVCRWQTSQEVNTSHFIVHRSYDGLRFENAGRVQATGKMYNVYNFPDHLSSGSGQSSTIYYRLEMVDKDGSSTYSSVVTIKVIRKSLFTISPNPAHTFVRIKGNGLQQVVLFDEHGKRVLTRNFSRSDNYTLRIEHLSTGVYVAQLKDDQDNVQTEKLIIRK